jgi:hypothetical protein
MQKYQFTGHLSPLPPGVKLPLQIFGEVYLVTEVEEMVDRLLSDKNTRIAQLEHLNATLERSNKRLRQKIDRLSS